MELNEELKKKEYEEVEFKKCSANWENCLNEA